MGANYNQLFVVDIVSRCAMSMRGVASRLDGLCLVRGTVTRGQ